MHDQLPEAEKATVFDKNGEVCYFIDRLKLLKFVFSHCYGRNVFSVNPHIREKSLQHKDRVSDKCI